MSLHYLGKHEPPETVFSVTVANWVFAKTTTLSDRNNIFPGWWPSSVVLGFEFHQNRSSGFGAVEGVEICPFPLICMAIGLYEIVISQQIKEVTGNRHEKLNKLMIAQTPQLLRAKNY